MDFFPAVIIISLIGGIVAVDTVAGWQIMISQPVVTCPLLGVIFGQPEIGVLLGILLELPWLINIPTGGAHGSEGNLGAVVAATLSIYLISHNINTENIIIIVSIIYSLAISRLGHYLVDIVRRANLTLIHSADKAANQADMKKITMLNISGLFYMFILGFTLICAGFTLGIVLIQPLVKFIHPDFDYAFGLAKYGLLGLGFGAVATFFLNKETKWYFIIALIASALALGLVSM